MLAVIFISRIYRLYACDKDEFYNQITVYCKSRTQIALYSKCTFNSPQNHKCASHSFSCRQFMQIIDSCDVTLIISSLGGYIEKQSIQLRQPGLVANKYNFLYVFFAHIYGDI